MIHFPFVWIVTVANINLNKYSILEKYAHKESLAKSYEKYRTEVEKLEHTDNEDVEALQLKLMELNLSAMAKNPADTMKQVVSNNPINKIADKLELMKKD